ncbi:enoyl-CoA hydratase-related protein [Scleromatobacter humisilvae]|uniref:Enoyl-CoA hydratase-related protein n=1 Tax=Scleromatobacter humisilvae TaxID=2897159 RepID=A0A9X1YPX6_9BURK|nr:enoyl-CoA hydratase-related protein [Scleromatobacter humisilvae]MCK9685686.1 enoyl-CoA hydratase-related protein [Scleromatobacter humisilvae]
MEHVHVRREGAMTIVTIDRPDRLNALHPPGHHELAAVFDEFARDPDQWVAVLTASGDRAFCAGNDLRFRAEHGRHPMPASGFGGLTSRFDLNKPVIAAVNGLAAGGGFELALACDIVVAGEHATFSLPEVQVGLAALAGGLHRLPRHVGLKVAMGIALTGRRVDAAEALQLGLVNQVVARGAELSGAFAWARTILDAAPLAVRATKATLLQGLEISEPDAAMQAQERNAAVHAMRDSADALEGPRAFAERRRPDWLGR